MFHVSHFNRTRFHRHLQTRLSGRNDTTVNNPLWRGYDKQLDLMKIRLIMFANLKVSPGDTTCKRTFIAH